ncbi:MAG: hypothetical protein J4F39_17395 [Candidatus Latescibacteria bacterium]|nr:hypothetical protein [Candidatus Latescibacterota bacterium]
MAILNDGVFWVEWFMLSAVLGVGLYICLSDIYARTVPNAWTVGLIGIGLAGQAIMLISGITTANNVVGLITSSVIVAVGMTFARVWGPGDGKLFLGTAVALPPTLCPSYNMLSLHTASSALVINAIVCFFMYGLSSMFFTGTKDRILAKELKSVGFYLRSAVKYLGFLGLILGMTVLALRRPISYLEALAVLVVGYRVLDSILQVRHWSLLVWPGCVAVIYLSLATDGIFIYLAVGTLAWVLELAYRTIRNMYGQTFTHSVPILSLQPGIVPSQSVYLESQRQVDVRTDGNEAERILLEGGQPLTRQDLNRLNQLACEGVLPRDRQIEVDRPIPFVPFITAGALLTAMMADNVGSAITRLIVQILSDGAATRL